MRVRVLLFGPYAVAANAGHIDVDVPDNANASGVLRSISMGFPALAAMVAGARLAVNHSFALDDDAVRAGDELALIGMVSGG